MFNFIKNIITKNFTKGSNKKNEYIVVHYTTDLTSKAGRAMANRNNFNTSDRQASAHYVVDDETIVQCVEDFDVSWHCGGSPNKWQPEGSKYHGICKNSNSIGIEMCSYNTSGKPYSQCQAQDKEWFFTDAVIDNTVILVADLMQKYNIPLTNVIMHWDVTGKWCPSPFLNDKAEYLSFRAKIANEIASREGEKMEKTFREQFNEIRKELQDNDSSAWSKEAREWAIKEGLVQGNGSEINGEPNYMWQDFVTREQMVTILYRLFNKK